MPHDVEHERGAVLLDAYHPPPHPDFVSTTTMGEDVATVGESRFNSAEASFGTKEVMAMEYMATVATDDAERNPSALMIMVIMFRNSQGRRGTIGLPFPEECCGTPKD